VAWLLPSGFGDEDISGDKESGHERDYADAEPQQSHHFPFKPPNALLQQDAFVVHTIVSPVHVAFTLVFG
jgi:hypothetical protein